MSFIPFLVLIVLITCCVAVFGNATLDGASQVTLLIASAVSVLIGHFSKRLKWENLEQEITDKIDIVLSKDAHSDAAVEAFRDYICNQVLGHSLTLADHVEDGTELDLDEFKLQISIRKC